MAEPLVQLTIDGAVQRPTTFSFDDFLRFRPEAQVTDVSQFHPGRRGDAVTLSHVPTIVRLPLESATWGAGPSLGLWRDAKTWKV